MKKKMTKTDWERIAKILDPIYEDYQGTDDDWGKAISEVAQELKREREEMGKMINRKLMEKEHEFPYSEREFELISSIRLEIRQAINNYLKEREEK